MKPAWLLIATLYASALLADTGDWRKIELQDIPDSVERVSVSAPVFGQVVHFPVSKYWKAAHEQATTGEYILELIPQDETLDTWTEMLSLHGYRGKGKADPVIPEAMMVMMAMRLVQVCAGRQIIVPLGERQVDAHDAYAAIMGCGSVVGGDPEVRSDQGEVAYYLVIKGAEDLYMLQSAVRRPVMNSRSSPIRPETVGAIERVLLSTKLCDRSGEPDSCWSRDPR
jgi:hypothetical protein